MRQRSMLRRILRFRDWSIRYKMLVGLILAALVPLTVLRVTDSISRYQIVSNNAQFQLGRTSENAAQVINRELQTKIAEISNVPQNFQLTAQLNNHARAMYNNPDRTDADSLQARTSSVMESTIEQFDYYESLRFLSVEGQLFAYAGRMDRTPSLTAPDQSTHPAFVALQDLQVTPREAVLLPPYTDPESGALLLEVGIQIINASTPMGYLFMSIDPALLLAPLDTESDLSQLEYLEDAYMYLVDEAGWLLTPVEGVRPFERQIDINELEAGPAQESGGPRALSVGNYTRDWGEGEVRVIAGSAMVESLGWTVLAEIEAEALATPIIRSVMASTIPLFLVVLAVAGVLLVVVNLELVEPIVQLTRVTQMIANGYLDSAVSYVNRDDEIGQLNRALATMTDNLRLSIRDLEQRVQARTRDLEMTTIVAREASVLDDVDALLNEAINLIVENFSSVYHAQVFLLDARGEYANLAASTGEPGRQLLSRGHRLAVGSVSVIGRVTELGETVIARDASTSRVHRKNEFLPETRAEMALPLRRGNRIIGALDVQSRSADAFTPEEQAVFETLAAQLAVTLDNAQRFEEITALAQETERLNRMLTRSDWHEILATSRRPGYLDSVAGELPQNGHHNGWSRWQEEAARQKAVVVSPAAQDGMCVMAVPILSRGEVLGVIEWQIMARQITDNTRQMAQELANRLAVSLETVRLLERSTRLAERERLANEISGKLTAEPTVELILQRAVEELTDILQTPQVNIQLKRPQAAQTGPMESA